MHGGGNALVAIGDVACDRENSLSHTASTRPLGSERASVYSLSSYASTRLEGCARSVGR